MRAKTMELISVIWSFDANMRRTRIYKIAWQRRDFYPGKIDFHHTAYQGKVLIHYFSLADEKAGIYFKLAFNTKTLHWVLEEAADALGTE